MNDRELFVGCYCRKLQKDRRLWIPAEFRSIFSHALQNPKHRLVLQQGDHGVQLCLGTAVMARGERCHCLMCLVPEMTAMVNPGYGVWPVSFDRQGGLRIPAASLEFIRAKPGENVILLGLVDNVEIISERVWREKYAAPDPTQVA